MPNGEPPPTAAYADVVDKLGTIAAPLLGGFALTLLGLVVSRDAAATIRWPNIALAALAIAAILFLIAVQCTISARQFLISPEEYRTRTPALNENLRECGYTAAMSDYRAWATRARIAFDLGLTFLLLGLLGVVIPPGDVSHFSGGRWTAMAAVALALVAEIWWLAHDEWKAARWNRGIRRFYAPPDT